MKREIGFAPLSREQSKLLSESMRRMDGQYDPGRGLLGTEEAGHGVRVSAHYALGLLARNQPGDTARASRVLRELLELQFTGDPQNSFYGSFHRNDQEPEPPSEPFPGRCFDATAVYWLGKWREMIQEKFHRHLEEAGYDRKQAREIGRLLEKSEAETVPMVWVTFDPNWREFLGMDFAMILAAFGRRLETDLVKALEKALVCAADGSIARYHSGIYPMNTNIELMHIFLCAFLGEWLGREDYRNQALMAADRFERSYREFHSVAEYNSTTYYAVDLAALSAWRQFLDSERLRGLGEWLEEQLWRDIAEMYHPLLHNLCGPFSRGYEMDMGIHSLMPACLYLGLGEDHMPMPPFNCELAGNIVTSLLGTCIPEDLREKFLSPPGERQVCRKFRELMERDLPTDNTSVCEATAWIAQEYMLGGLRGSRNTSGQLRSATAFWRAPDGSVSNLALLRREPGEGCEHVRKVYFDNRVDGNHMEIRVRWELERDMELVFAVNGRGLTSAMAERERWSFPGMTVRVSSAVWSVGETLGRPGVREVKEGLEIVYCYRWRDAPCKEMRFELDFVTGSREG